MNKTTQEVTKTQEVKTQAKFDLRKLAEQIEAGFKSAKTVDVIADSNREYPKSVTYTDYSFIHFYNPGTEKDMFQLYTSSRGAKFIVKTATVDVLDKSVKATVAEKDGKRANYGVIKCTHAEIADIANKLISAYQNTPEKPKKQKPAKTEKPKTEKKAEPKKPAPKKPAPKKPATKEATK